MVFAVTTVPCDHHYFNMPIGYCWYCEFIPEIRALANKFGEKWPEYKDSYKTDPIKFLLERLNEEYQELQSNLSYDELIDVANVALMLAKRIKEGGS